MANTRRKAPLRPGDKVTVPWGVHEVTGEVALVYGPPGHKSVIVRIPVTGPAGEPLDVEEVSFPEDAIRLGVAV
jgi:hypothetical protein